MTLTDFSDLLEPFVQFSELFVHSQGINIMISQRVMR